MSSLYQSNTDASCHSKFRRVSLVSYSLYLVLLIGPNGWSQGSASSTSSATPPAGSISSTPAASQSGTDPAAGWPEASRKAAQAMIEKYGQPSGVTPDMLVWNKTGPWKQTIVSKAPVDHKFPKPHQDVLEQCIDYKVPPDKFDDLAEFDGSVIVERTKGEISARCDKEPMNFLAINLAHEVATGKKSADEARKEYTKQAMAFMKKEPAPYTEKLIFEPQANTADPDEPAPEAKQE